MARRLLRTFISLLIGVMAIAVLLMGSSKASPFTPASANTLLGSGPLATHHESAQVSLCQFGAGATDSIANYDIAPLRLGWYVNWQASLSPPRPYGIQYVPTIRFQPLGIYSYTYSPRGSQLQQVIHSNPGTDWLIGNEPDRRQWQDDLTPDVYARAYHELYYLIKAADPTSHIFVGGIVQPTPVRLQYLDLVLSNYQDFYGRSLPADGWNIHNFILNEVSCNYDPGNCWGADIPPGIDAPYGEILTVQDNDNFDIFKQRIVRFRQWMTDRGYGGLPVYLTEYGVQMPADYGFSPSRVNAFMTKTFDYLRTATDPSLGDPADGYRLIQRWIWYSLSDDSFNGWMFDPTTHQRTVFGDHWATYTAELSPTIDLYPVRVFADPATPYSQGENVTFTLKVQVANSGNISSTQPITVRFYEGSLLESGSQIGTDQVISPLFGCGDSQIAQVEWANVTTGTHSVYVQVDPASMIAETDEGNNVLEQTILVATHRAFLPIIWKTSR